MTAWSSSFSDDLAERWDEYVDCPSRLALEGTFLLDVLCSKKKSMIFDAAGALGCESLFLAQAGFAVTHNEIDARLRTRAKAVARKRGLRVTFSSIDWREIAEYAMPQSLGAVLILGNSLCLLPDAGDRLAVCEQIYEVLEPGGFFLVDQRNFDYILRCREEILAGDFRYSARVMYCERSIIGRPTIIESDRVRLACFDKYTHRRLGHFDVWPLRTGDLEENVKAAGFSEIKAFFDFRKTEEDHWDFKTLVCRKT